MPGLHAEAEAANPKKVPSVLPVRWAARWLGSVYPVLLVLISWEVVARIIANQLFLPPFSTVLVKFFQLALDGSLWLHTWASLLRSMAGFFLASLAGIPLGLFMGSYGVFDHFWGQLVSLSYPVPKIGLIPLFILWLGIGDASKIAVILAAAVYPVIMNTYLGVKGLPLHMTWSAQSLGANRWEMLARVTLPYAMPQIFTGLRLAMGIAWVLLFAAEMVAAQRGLGYLILFSQRLLETETVFAALLAIGLLGFLFDRLILLLSNRVCNWYSQRTS